MTNSSRWFNARFNGSDVLRRCQAMFQLMVNYPKIATVSILVPFVSVCIWYKEDRVTPICKKWASGARPELFEINHEVDRLKIKKELKKMCFPTDSPRVHFGVIYGPAGCGKTRLIKRMCLEYPRGVFYYQMNRSINFAQGLADAIGLRRGLGGIIGFTLSWFNPAYASYYYLQGNSLKENTDFLVNALRDAARKYKKMYGVAPVLIIDSSDILAKQHASVLQDLLQCAKVCADDLLLTFVFVSSDGSIIPAVQEDSSVSARASVYVVGDIEDDEAIRFLIDNGIPKHISTGVVDYTGGRLINLHHAIDGYSNGDCVNDVIAKINKKMGIEFSAAHATIRKHTPISTSVLKEIEDNGSITLNSATDDKKAEVVRMLVKANVLQYFDSGQKVKWHSQVMRREFLRFLA